MWHLGRSSTKELPIGESPHGVALPLKRAVQIDLGARNRRVPKEFLNRFQISPAAEQPRPKSMPERMRCEPARYAGSLQQSLQLVVQSTMRQGPLGEGVSSPPSEEQRGSAVGFGAVFLPGVLQQRRSIFCVADGDETLDSSGTASFERRALDTELAVDLEQVANAKTAKFAPSKAEPKDDDERVRAHTFARAAIRDAFERNKFMALHGQRWSNAHRSPRGRCSSIHCLTSLRSKR